MMKNTAVSILRPDCPRCFEKIKSVDYKRLVRGKKAYSLYKYVCSRCGTEVTVKAQEATRKKA